MTKDENPKAGEGGKLARVIYSGDPLTWCVMVDICLVFSSDDKEQAETKAGWINTAFRRAAGEIEAKACERAFDDSKYLLTAIKTMMDAFRVNDQGLQARAISIGQNCLDLENDRAAYFRKLAQEAKGK